MPTASLCVTFFKVPPVALVWLTDVDAIDPNPLCLCECKFGCVGIDVAHEFGKYDDRSDVLTDVFTFLQIGGAFEWSKSKYSNFPIWRPLAFDAIDIGAKDKLNIVDVVVAVADVDNDELL